MELVLSSPRLMTPTASLPDLLNVFKMHPSVLAQLGAGSIGSYVSNIKGAFALIPELLLPVAEAAEGFVADIQAQSSTPLTYDQKSALRLFHSTLAPPLTVSRSGPTAVSLSTTASGMPLTIELHDRSIYKVSMGKFSGTKKGKLFLEELRKRGWLTVNEYCPDGQGELFKSGLQKGDYVYACAGSQQLWGIYRISGDWQYFPDDLSGMVDNLEEWGYRPAELIAPAIKENTSALTDLISWWAPSGYRTVAPVTDLGMANEKLFQPYFNVKVVSYSSEQERRTAEEAFQHQFPNPNIILYGPPGTGKTHSTLEVAYEILTGRPAASYEVAQQLFRQELGQRLEFVTFHQSFTYEDFVQGFRPEVLNGNMVFQKTDGVFYRIAKRAREEYQRQTAAVDAPVAVGFEEVFNQLMEPLVERDEHIVLPMKSAGYQFSLVDFGDGYITFKRGKEGHLVNVQNSTLKSLYEGTLVQPAPTGNQIYHQAIVKRLHELSEHTEGSKAEAPLDRPRNYVLIIDEINRANIAKVFGELITLLEKDKRLGGTNTLPVTLPSGETNFTVPANLYLIGTMNTADRSLALLDIALRRRFEFRPLYPLDKINNQPIPHAGILTALNERIRHYKSRDFQIGHAYFLNPKETLPAIFNTKVIPLLYEYFLNDEAKVQTLLTEANIPCYLDETVGLRYGTAS